MSHQAQRKRVRDTSRSSMCGSGQPCSCFDHNHSREEPPITEFPDASPQKRLCTGKTHEVPARSLPIAGFAHGQDILGENLPWSPNHQPPSENLNFGGAVEQQQFTCSPEFVSWTPWDRDITRGNQYLFPNRETTDTGFFSPTATAYDTISEGSSRGHLLLGLDCLTTSQSTALENVGFSGSVGDWESPAWNDLFGHLWDLSPTRKYYHYSFIFSAIGKLTFDSSNSVKPRRPFPSSPRYL